MQFVQNKSRSGFANFAKIVGQEQEYDITQFASRQLLSPRAPNAWPIS
jgi:hypothetical protein